jgi:hypothetical protein
VTLLERGLTLKHGDIPGKIVLVVVLVLVLETF